MSAEEVLKRVEADLAAGHRALARQRLRSLASEFPQRLDLRERLAEVYRLDADWAQAGRWSYLAHDRDRAEIACFERAYGEDPVRMMRAIAWRGSEDDASTEVARDRLRALRARAEAEFGTPVDWELPRHDPEPPPGLVERVVGAGCALVAIGALLLLVIGALALVAEGFDVLTGWLT